MADNTNRTGRRVGTGPDDRSDQSNRVRSGPIRSDRVRSGPIRSDQVRSGAIRSDRVRSGPIGSDQVRSGAIRSDRVRSGPIGCDQVRSGAIRSDQVRSGPIGCDQVRAGPIRPGRQVRSGPDGSGRVRRPREKQKPMPFQAPASCGFGRIGRGWTYAAPHWPGPGILDSKRESRPTAAMARGSIHELSALDRSYLNCPPPPEPTPQPPSCI
jgi:hypothetical protein